MKKLNTLGFVAALAFTFGLTSCDKEGLTDISPVSSTTPSEILSSQALVVNAISNSEMTNLGVNINGVEIAAGLDYKEVTEYLGIETGELLIDVVAEDGTILASTSYNFLDNEIYNIALLAGEDGITPTIKILGVDPGNYIINDSFESELSLANELIDVFAVNVINYTIGTENNNLLLGLDYLGGGNTSITGLLDLEHGVLSNVFFGTEDILTNINLLDSDLPLEDLLEELNSRSGGVLDVLDLGGALGIGEILNSGTPAGLLGTVFDLVSGILGGDANPVDIIYGALIKTTSMVPGHEYTFLLVGTLQDLDLVIIDQTVAGLFEIIEQ